MHPRKRIRKALVARLEGALSNAQVTDQNPRQLDTPSVQVLTKAEVAADPSITNDAPRRMTSFGFVCRAKGEDVQDDLDDLAELVENAVRGPIEAGPVRGYLTYQLTEQDLDAEQSERVGTMIVTFDCEWSDR